MEMNLCSLLVPGDKKVTRRLTDHGGLLGGHSGDEGGEALVVVEGAGRRLAHVSPPHRHTLRARTGSLEKHDR